MEKVPVLEKNLKKEKKKTYKTISLAPNWNVFSSKEHRGNWKYEN